MASNFRQYNRTTDFQLVGDFLIQHFHPGNTDGNWLQPTWEYMHSHPNLDESALERIGIWEDGATIAGVANYESRLGEAFFQLHPDYGYLKPILLDYAEKHLFGVKEDGTKYLQAFINDFDVEFLELVRQRGYIKNPGEDRPTSEYTVPLQFPEIAIPEGFRLKSLADENDLVKIDRVLWRGFNHPGEPPADGVAGRKKMQSTPNFRKDLTIVVEAPGGDFVSFCGMWYEAKNRIAYVEPVATDPDFRRMGLGKAAVMEGIRRCAALGATHAYVGSDQMLYQALGFKKIYTTECWVKDILDLGNERELRTDLILPGEHASG